VSSILVHFLALIIYSPLIKPVLLLIFLILTFGSLFFFIFIRNRNDKSSSRSIKQQSSDSIENLPLSNPEISISFRSIPPNFNISSHKKYSSLSNPIPIHFPDKLLPLENSSLPTAAPHRLDPRFTFTSQSTPSSKHSRNSLFDSSDRQPFDSPSVSSSSLPIETNAHGARDSYEDPFTKHGGDESTPLHFRDIEDEIDDLIVQNTREHRRGEEEGLVEHLEDRRVKDLERRGIVGVWNSFKSEKSLRG
jgi:hypothetical protein